MEAGRSSILDGAGTKTGSDFGARSLPWFTVICSDATPAAGKYPGLRLKCSGDSDFDSSF